MSDAGDELEGTFAIFFAEGEILTKQGHYTKAVDSFSKALEFQPNEKACLVARSKCYLHLGDTESALKDAEDSLKENDKYHKGLFQKAEVLYAMGDFEHALVFFHRGHKVRPELHEFILGIQKAQEAINNSIGTPAACKLEKIGDLSFFHQQDSLSKKKAKRLLRPQLAQQKKERKLVASERTVKELLGELYSDREYLDKLMEDPTLVIGQKDHSIYNAVEEALIYLDSRTEFWRQQNPMYARKREKELKKYRPPPTKPRPVGLGGAPLVNHTKYILKTLEEVDNSLANGDAETSLQQAKKLMKMVKGLFDKDLPNKLEFVASLHSCIGNAHLELGNSNKALEHHLKDLELAEELELREIRSRALDNVGRVYAVMGEYKNAVKYWTMKLPLISTSEESAWLNHELGRCRMELEDYDEAVKLGEKSFEAATECVDHMWQLNASMLTAQAQSKLNEPEAAAQSYERALDLAKFLDDDDTASIIKKALDEMTEKIIVNAENKQNELEERNEEKEEDMDKVEKEGEKKEEDELKEGEKKEDELKEDEGEDEPKEGAKKEEDELKEAEKKEEELKDEEKNEKGELMEGEKKEDELKEGEKNEEDEVKDGEKDEQKDVVKDEDKPKEDLEEDDG